MDDQVTFGDFVLGLEGLAILRAWMADSHTIMARRRRVMEIASQFSDEPWSNPIVAEEKDVSSGYSEWADTYDMGGNPVVIAEEPVVHGLLDDYPDRKSPGRSLWHRETRRTPGITGTSGHRHRSHA